MSQTSSFDKAELEKIDRLCSEINQLQIQLVEAKADKDQAYLERNHLVACLARIYPSGIRKTSIEGWNPEWDNCVYIDLPAGQISYHYHVSQAFLFEDLPVYEKLYNGHTKEDVHTVLKKTWTWGRLIPLTWLREWIEEFKHQGKYMTPLTLNAPSSSEYGARVRTIVDILDKLEQDANRAMIDKAGK